MKVINIDRICKILQSEYKDAHCALNFKNGFELLIAARLSAQCKDDRVNAVTKKLFEAFPDVHSLAVADVDRIEKIIKPCGLFRTKSKNLKDIANIIEKKFNSTLPYGLENLQELPGIGRKTANLIMSEVFGEPAIIVDTHVSRITRKLGLHNQKDPLKIELELQKSVRKTEWSVFCHCLVYHGRNCCTARSPKCCNCCLQRYCKFYVEKINDEKSSKKVEDC